ncbi:LLM class flavin-dependent oxidoreductase [Nocardia sp. NPDC057227]|uniref:LLM class flavin-dependent oxidoreductase n=1 Tax=Nocardia sp. NPDC057227 TaxID=3346056 RepID=UPI0036335BFA
MTISLGFLTHLHAGRSAGDAYAIALELFEAAEEIGFDIGWVAQHHFGDDGGRLASPLTFLAAAAQRTKRIGLGTAVVVLPTEDPVRVAEDALLVDTLSGGRLQLGIGTGGDPVSFAAFGRDVERRRELFDEAAVVLEDALAGRPINGTAATIGAEGAAISGRLWQSTLSEGGAARIAARGHGLLVARSAYLSSLPTDIAQRPLVERYRAIAGACARVGVSRTVYPARDRRTAAGELRAGVEAYARQMAGQGHYPPGLTTDAAFDRAFIHYGHPDQVAASLAADRALPGATHLICQAAPGQPEPARVIRALESVARDVLPRLAGARPRPEAALP